MENKPQIGIIGCGAIAESHRKGYEQNGLAPVAFADVSAERATAFAAKTEGARGYGSHLELLESGVTAVSICTPPNSHREIAVAALERGIHVLCEKPLAGTLEDSRAIETAAVGSNAVFMMAFRHRFLPAHQKMRELIRSGGLGKIVLFRNIFGGPNPGMKDKWFSRRAISGGGSLMDTSIHAVDLFRFYCGEIAAVSGQVNRMFSGTDVEDSGVLSLRSESGALGLVASSWNIGAYHARVEIDTEEGALSFNYHQKDVIFVRRKEAKTDETFPVTPSNGFTEQIASFLQTLADRRTPSPSVLDGLRAVEAISRVYANETL